MAVLTNAKFKTLRAALDAFKGVQQILGSSIWPDEGLVETTAQLVEQTNKRVPGALLPFSRDQYVDPLSHNPVKKLGLMSYLATAVSFLSAAIEGEGSITAEQLLDFAYIRNAELRPILQRDYRELLRTVNGKCWKSSVILSGGLIETLLVDQLVSVSQEAYGAPSAPKKNQDILTWRFVELIDVAVEVGIISKGAQKLSHSVREYRNLVHPHKELKDALVADEQEAKIALHVLSLIDRDLQP